MTLVLSTNVLVCKIIYSKILKLVYETIYLKKYVI